MLLGDFDGDGDLEAIALDQGAGEIILYKHGGDPETVPWTAAVLLDTRPNLQDAHAIDIDGDGRPEIVYTWEGDGAGSGGVNWLDFDGSDPTDPADWTDYVMVQHNGAWWLGSSGRLDLSADGNETDIVFSARDARNPNAVPGIYWLEEPATVTNAWTEHTIDNTAADWTHVDTGDLSGNGHSKDVLAVARGNGAGAYWYDYGDSWAKTALSGTGSANVRTAPYRRNGRDSFLSPIESDGLYLFEWNGTAYEGTALINFTYSHAMEDRLVWHGQDLYVADSGGKRLFWLKIR